MATGYNYSKYSDELAHKKRRRFFLKLYLTIVIILLSISSLVYLLFISSVMRISDVSINGLKTVESSEIFLLTDSFKNKEYFWKFKLKIQSNLMFFDTKSLHDEIVAKFPVIKDVEIIKNYPRDLKIDITERTPMGTWCFTDTCKYFDNSGVLWGKALRSYGSLLISIEDMNSSGDQINNLNDTIFESIKTALEGFEKNEITIKKVEIPDESLTDFKIYTAAGYYIMFSTESDIMKQLEVLRIFLKEKPANFHPEYIDLRIDGRVYYK